MHPTSLKPFLALSMMSGEIKQMSNRLPILILLRRNTCRTILHTQTWQSGTRGEDRKPFLYVLFYFAYNLIFIASLVSVQVYSAMPTTVTLIEIT